MPNFSLVSVDVEIDPWKVSGITIAGLTAIFGAYKLIRSMRRVRNREEKCVFITGCDSGFGRALAISLDESGIPVFAGCYTETGAKSLQDETSKSLKTLIVDVTDDESVDRAYAYVKQNMPEDKELWGVVNNAGSGGAAGFVEFYSMKQFEDVMKVNFFGPVRVVNRFLPLLKRSSGRIVNMCSAVCIRQVPAFAAYTASKFALLGYTEVLRKEKAMWGIKVSAILPGYYRTDVVDQERNMIGSMMSHLPQDIREEYGEEYLKDYAEKQLKRTENDGRTDLSPVVNAIEHALYALYPRDRYTCDVITSMVSSVPERVITGKFLPDQLPKALQA